VSQEIFKDRYYFRGDSRSPETIFASGFEINPNKIGPKITEPFGSSPEYLSFSSSFMGAAAFPILNEHNPEE
jgi:hypothetical protein